MPIIIHNQEGKEISAEWNSNINFEFFQCLNLFEPQLQQDNEDSYIFEDNYIINSNNFNQIPIYQKAQVIDFCVNLLQTRSEQDYEDLTKGLLDLIRQSKSKSENQIAAANALSILVKAGYQFIEEDFEKVNIQNANLTNGVFFRCNFSGSSLVSSNLSDVYMQECNLQNVDLQAATLSTKKVWLQQTQLPCLQMFYKKAQQKYTFSSTLNLFAFYHLVQQEESTIIKLHVVRKNGTVLLKKDIELQQQQVNEVFIQFCQEDLILLSQYDLFIFNTISSKFTNHSLDQYQRSESSISCSKKKNLKIVKRDGVYLLFWENHTNRSISYIAHWNPSYDKLVLNQTQFYQKDLVYYQIDSITGIINQIQEEQGLSITINQVKLDEIENQSDQVQLYQGTYQINKSKEIENSWEFEMTFKYFVYVEQTNIVVQEIGVQNNLMQINMLNTIQFVKEIDQNYLLVLSGSQQNSNKLAYIIDLGKILSTGQGNGQNVNISMYVPFADVFPFSQKDYECIKWDRETQYLYTQDSTPAWIFKFQQNKLALKHCFGVCGFSNFQNSYGELKNINQQKLELLQSVGYKISKINPKLIQCQASHQHSLELKVKEGQNKTMKCKECQVTNQNTFLYYCKECNQYLCLNHKNQQNQFKNKINYQDQKQTFENGQFKCQICNALYNFGHLYNDQFKNQVYCEWCAEGKSYNIQ